MPRSTHGSGSRFTVGTTQSNVTMNQMEQVVVFIVVGLAIVLFLGVFIVFVCRCSKRCPTYRYSIALFEQYPGDGTRPHHRRHRRPSTTPHDADLRLPSPPRRPLPADAGSAVLAHSLMNKRTPGVVTVCPHLPPYSELWTVASDRSKTPPPEYDDLVCELVPLSRPPSYESIEDNESENSREFVALERH